MRTVLVLALGGCAAVASTDVISNGTPDAGVRRAVFTLEPGAIGPITEATRATADAIQAAVGSRFVVKPIDERGVELHVFLGEELLFYVIPNDDGSLFNVHCTSPKVAITEHPEWIIGSPFVNSEPLTACECWGSHPMCFRAGDHVAVGFQLSCDNLDSPAARKALEGVRIQRAVWNPKPFGGPSSDTSSPPPPKSLLVPPAGI
jgi:hypothetical protein